MDDGQARGERPRFARGTAPNVVSRADVPDACTVAQAAAGSSEEPARTIHEAVERWIDAREADEALAEWSQARA
jgi:hypothetical protein